jgi:GR25 family glycosyltransferase involved in LPS biosynthesis
MNNTQIICLVLVLVLVLALTLPIKSKSKVITEEELVRMKNTIQHLDNTFKTDNDSDNIIQRNLCNISIYFINMNRSADRLESMNKQIDFYNIPNITRIEAVDGLQIFNKYSDSYTFGDGNILNFSINNYTNYSKGELGCSLSHISAIKTSYDNGDEYSLIIEDDTYLGLIPMWEKSLCEVIEGAPSDWGILQLYSGSVHIKDVNKYKHWANYWGMVAYIINRTGMEIIINKLYIDDNTILINKNIPSPKISSDWMIYNIINNSHIVRAYTTKVMFIPNNNELDSVIHPSYTIKHLKKSNKFLKMYTNPANLFEHFSTQEDYNKIGNDVVKMLPKKY